MDKAEVVAKLQAQLNYLGNCETAWLNKVFHYNDGLVEMAFVCGAITSGERAGWNSKNWEVYQARSKAL